MKASTYIRSMLAGNKIEVPNYQRAYSWDTPQEGSDRKTQTDIFLSDLEEYSESNTKEPYYFGHFLFEMNANDVDDSSLDYRNSHYYVIDGQQRLTTIIIFLSALFEKLRQIRKDNGNDELNEQETQCFQDMIRWGSNTYRFSTVEYDNRLFKDYVIDQIKKDEIGFDTESIKRIADAFSFFKRQICERDENYITRMIKIVSNASCSTHIVEGETKAIQMFIFQNNRGKKPSNLEIIKAQFMYNIHLYGGEEKSGLIKEIKNRFENIYQSISLIEYEINEDEVLNYTLKIYFYSLSEGNALDKINKQLSGENQISFIKTFTHALELSFQYLRAFFGDDQRQNFAIHSIITLGGLGIAFPFIIKAYKFGLDINRIGRLCKSLESLVLRHRIIGTRAAMTSRLSDIFKEFTESNDQIDPIIERIEWMKTTTEWWYAYWNNDEFKKALQGGLNHSVAKYLLWKYENQLKGEKGKAGYTLIRYETIENPELEHIAPQVEPSDKPHGYGEYDEEFINQYIDCLGNYLLLSMSHNRSIKNYSFNVKHKDYDYLEQQREIQNLVPEEGPWGKEIIEFRKEKIVKFIMDTF